MKIVEDTRVSLNFTSIDNRIGILETLCAECGAMLTNVAIKQQRNCPDMDDYSVPISAAVRKHSRNTLLPI